MSDMVRRIVMMMQKAASALVYGTWNTADKSIQITLSVGDHVASSATAANEPVRGTLGKSSGKWYWESVGGNLHGISKTGLAMTSGNYPGSDANGVGYHTSGDRYYNGSASTFGASWNQTDVISVLLNMDDGEVIFWKNGVAQGSAFTGLSGTYYPTNAVFGSVGRSPTTINQGDSAFTYSPPGGYTGLHA